jgi:hypothetical protein
MRLKGAIAAREMRLGAGRGEDGLTLVELLVAATMGIVVVWAAGTMVIAAMRSQPNLSGRAQDISTARWELERLTRELREGIAVDRATASEVSFKTFVRRTHCGGAVSASDEPAIDCEVTYACAAEACTRSESAPGTFGGTPEKIFEGIGSGEVFSYKPAGKKASEITYVGVTLRLPNPSGSGNLTISDGANLRNATLRN